MKKRIAMVSAAIIIPAVALSAGLAMLNADAPDCASKCPKTSYQAAEQTATCPLAAVSKTCSAEKAADACPPDCEKACCAAKIKSGTCPKAEGRASCPKTCPKKQESK